MKIGHGHLTVEHSVLGLLKQSFGYAFFLKAHVKKTKSVIQWYSYFVHGGVSFETTKVSFS